MADGGFYPVDRYPFEDQEPGPLYALLERVKDWRFTLHGCGFHARLLIDVPTTDSLTGYPTVVRHMQSVPYVDHPDLVRWLFEQISKVERHEAMEFFKLDGRAPYFPDHTPGGDPYALIDRLAGDG